MLIIFCVVDIVILVFVVKLIILFFFTRNVVIKVVVSIVRINGLV